MRRALIIGIAVVFAAIPTLVLAARFGIIKSIPVPNVVAGGDFSFDISYVDAASGRYMLSDRTNSAVDVFDARTGKLIKLVKGFTGAAKTSSSSGPNGLAGIPGTSLVYAGDIGSIKLVDFMAGKIVASIPIPNAKMRTDEGCYDADDRVAMFANPDDLKPFVTWISTATNKRIARLQFVADGLEQCVYDPHTKNFLVNNDGTPKNPGGEVDVIPASSVLKNHPVISVAYAVPGCALAGMALARDEKLLLGCSADKKGVKLLTLVMNAASGAILKMIAQVGGEDQVAYDDARQRFYTASRDMTASGIAGKGAVTPVLGVIDARTLSWISNVPTGPNAHSVATDAKTGRVFVPVAPSATSAGGINVYGYRN
ncbi:MAG TPA: hypothetical protein VGG22_00565 [Candidatus Baltobacteraceae bacterium]|jgi:hypothetical protein